MSQLKPMCLLCDEPVAEKDAVIFTTNINACICRQCRADAALGRAVRKMPKTGSHLWHHYDNTWGFYDGIGHRREVCDEATPEAALQEAGLMEVEK